MCGFIGRISQQAPHLRNSITAGLPFLERRGPDSVKKWRSGDNGVELMHVRLAIIDTDSRAHQPMTNSEYGVTVSFIGEIYNYQEIREELTPYFFKTNSDTEVLLALFCLKGIEGLKKVRGMFALVIVDEKSKRIYLARDPVGKKPLYCAQWEKEVYFGSNILSFAAVARNAPRIQTELLENFWKDGYVSPDRSIFRDCFPVLPGHILEFDWNGSLCGESSCVPKINKECAWPDLNNAGQRLSALLEESVRRRLTNNPKPVCLLSGGIDSTVIADQMRSRGVGSAVTIGSLIPMGLDEKYARYAAHHLKMKLQVVRPQMRKLAGEVEWALGLQDEPLGMMAFFPLALMFRELKNYSKIVMTGDGGDEVFLGYGRPDAWIERQTANAGPKSPQILNVGCPAPEWMSEWGLKVVGNSLLGHMFTKLDRASAEQGIEARCPLLDWDVLCFARSLPANVLFLDGRPKGLLVAQLTHWPRWFVRRPKMGFPYHLRWEWGLRGFSGLRELISKESIEAFEPFLPSQLQRPSHQWSWLDVFNNFPSVWKLLSWSRFSQRLKTATSTA